MNAVAEKNLSRIQREKRSKIQKAALEVFSEYGLRSATLDKIATACGLTKPEYPLLLLEQRSNIF